MYYWYAERERERERKREVSGVVDVICIDMPFWWSVALIYIYIVHADIGFYE